VAFPSTVELGSECEKEKLRFVIEHLVTLLCQQVGNQLCGLDALSNKQYIDMYLGVEPTAAMSTFPPDGDASDSNSEEPWVTSPVTAPQDLTKE
jgi:hypothetical protein